jgi:4-hydroxybenzoate polyprenyltransferase
VSVPADSLVPTTGARSRAARLLAYAIETHPPLVYVLVAGSWSWSVMGLMAVAAPHAAGEAAGAWARIGPAGWVMSAVFFLVLLYLRAVDEVKDLAYDRVHNPGRPLVRGAVSVAESWGLAAGVAGVVLGLCAALNPYLVPLVSAQMAYGLLLFVMEQRWVRFRQSIVLNLLLTFPVSATLNVLAWVYLAGRGLAPEPGLALTALAAQVAIFLHLEVGRKLKWPHLSDPAENGYALALGVPGAVAACGALGVAACVAAQSLLARAGLGAWACAPWLALLPSALGLWRWSRQRDRVVELKPYFGGAMILFGLVNALLSGLAPGR